MISITSRARHLPFLRLHRTQDNDVTSLRLDDFYAFHPKLRPLLPAFKEGRLGIVQAVGTDNPTGSHFEAQDQMEHGEGYGRMIGGGWLGRYLRRARRADDVTYASLCRRDWVNNS